MISPPQQIMPSAGRTFRTSFDGFYPLGFKSDLAFQEFVIDLYMNLPVFDGTFISKVFDAGRTSDYDIAIASEELFKKAKNLNISTKDGNHTEPLKDTHLVGLGLKTLQANADARIANYSTKKREVNFMIYDSVESAKKHTGPSLVCPEPTILRMGTTIQMYNYMLGHIKFKR